MREIDKLWARVYNNSNRCNALLSDSVLPNGSPTLVFKEGVEEEYYYLQRENNSLIVKIKELTLKERKEKGIRFDFGCVN